MVEEKGKIFIKNLPIGTTRDELFQLFSTIGPLKEVILPKPKGNFPTIFGFVSFQDEKDSNKAISQYNNLEFCNLYGRKCHLSIKKSFQRVSKLESDLSRLSCSSLWSVGSQESDKGSVGSDTGSVKSEKSTVKEMKYLSPEPEWMKERQALMEIIAENDRKISELQKKKGEEQGDSDLERREKQLLEELERLPIKIHTLKEEIEVLKLQVKLKDLEREQNQILSK